MSCTWIPYLFCSLSLQYDILVSWKGRYFPSFLNDEINSYSNWLFSLSDLRHSTVVHSPFPGLLRTCHLLLLSPKPNGSSLDSASTVIVITVEKHRSSNIVRFKRTLSRSDEHWDSGFHFLTLNFGARRVRVFLRARRRKKAWSLVGSGCTDFSVYISAIFSVRISVLRRCIRRMLLHRISSFYPCVTSASYNF